MVHFLRAALVLAMLSGSTLYALAFWPKDSRQILPDYARTHNIDLKFLEDQLSASGTLDCKTKIADKNATANLVLTNRVLVTNAHLFCNVSDATVKVKPGACKFKFFDHGANKFREIPLAYYVLGTTCVPGKNPPTENDWAVATLQSPATGTRPYAIPKDGELRAHLKAIHFFGSHAMDFCSRGQDGKCILDTTVIQRKDRRFYKMPPFLADCQIRNFSVTKADASTLEELFTDCPSGHGASGGPYLSWDLKNPVIYGIVAANPFNKEQLHREAMTGEPTMGEYHFPTGENDPVPAYLLWGPAVDGKFRDAIKAAAGAL